MGGRTQAAALALCLSLSWLHAQEPLQETREEILVFGTKTEQPIEQVTSRTVVITRQEIERHQWRTVADILQQLPGASLVRNGGDGALTTVFSRGAKSENTLVLINGVKANDPSGVGRGYDFGNLSTAGIDRLELILGPQSTLYGSDASSGVINILTRGGGAGYANSVGLEYSDGDSGRLDAGLGGESGGLRYALNAEHFDGDSISASGLTPLDRLEKDRYRNTTAHLNLGYKLDENADTGLDYSLIDGYGDIDGGSSDDPNSVSTFRQQLISWRYKRDMPARNWQTSLLVSFSDIQRDNDNPEDDIHPGSANSGTYSGSNLGVEFRNRIQPAEHWDLLLGLTYEREAGSGDAVFASSGFEFFDAFDGEAETAGLFTNLDFAQGGFYATLGARYDDHDQFGGKTTWRAAAGYHVAPVDLRLRASYATGFKAPSVYQQFSAYGNLDLNPESSKTTEVGLTKGIASGRGLIGLTWYRNDYRALIEFFTDPNTFFSFYDNIDKAESSGVEIYGSYSGKVWSLYLGYEDADADNTSDPANSIPLIRRFDDKASLRLTAHPREGLDLFCDLLYYGQSSDTDFSSFPSQDLVLDGYTLINLGAGYDFGEALGLRARAENLTDEDYVQVIGYQVNGRRLFLGVNYRF